ALVESSDDALVSGDGGCGICGISGTHQRRSRVWCGASRKTEGVVGGQSLTRYALSSGRDDHGDLRERREGARSWGEGRDVVGRVVGDGPGDYRREASRDWRGRDKTADC